MQILTIKILLVTVLLFAYGCNQKETLPARTEIPIIKDQLSKIETGVRLHSQASLDSLMSVKMIERQLTSDSLIRAVWNSVPLGRFGRFSDCEVSYSDNIAQCDCGIADETGKRQAGILLTFTRDEKLWLLREFKVNPADTL